MFSWFNKKPKRRETNKKVSLKAHMSNTLNKAYKHKIKGIYKSEAAGMLWFVYDFTVFQTLHTEMVFVSYDELRLGINPPDLSYIYLASKRTKLIHYEDFLPSVEGGTLIRLSNGGYWIEGYTEDIWQAQVTKAFDMLLLRIKMKEVALSIRNENRDLKRKKQDEKNKEDLKETWGYNT